MSKPIGHSWVSRSIDQQTLDVLERIETLLKTLVERGETCEAVVEGELEDLLVNITPQETPFASKTKKSKQRK